MIRRKRSVPYLEARTEPASAETAQLEREGYAIVHGLLDAVQCQNLSKICCKLNIRMLSSRQPVGISCTSLLGPFPAGPLS